MHIRPGREVFPLQAARESAQSMGTAPIGRIELGERGTGVTFTIDFDDVAVDTVKLAYSPLITASEETTTIATATQSAPTATPSAAPTSTSAPRPTATTTPTSVPAPTIAPTPEPAVAGSPPAEETSP